jgi:hypothetical protein
MRKLATFVGLVAVMMVAAGITFSDELVPFPFWQHGWGCTTFFSVANVNAPASAVVTITLMKTDGSVMQATTGTVANYNCWLPDTGNWDGWYTAGDYLGWGTFQLTSTSDTVYLWSCIYGALPQGQAGYTIVLPQNPYGV